MEIRFIIPLLERLGYSEEDRVDGCTIEMTIGSRKVKGEADFVLYDGTNRSRDNVLLIVEAKRNGTRLEQAVEQARSYAMFLGAPFYLVTNGDDLRVFRFKSALETDVEVFQGTRETLGSRFHLLHGSISKSRVADLRRVLRR
ncbi:type I restriction enzyme HsdR N-terminal domain-containing protein [Mesoterricola silvestris]|uniref:type I restriction enzyme HsdR N-terminal domain-containing protein n=1 Tax=Mesoterricola silvestris TaxID=2927979 RepID=UPI0037445EB3